MRKLILLFCSLPFILTAQEFTKIDGSVTGFTQGVNSPLQTIKTIDGHIWFNSLVASRYRLYEYDGSSYTYHPQYYDSTVAGLRDIHARNFAQATDGTIYTDGGQFYKNGEWRKLPHDRGYMAMSQDGNTLYFNKSNDSILALSNGTMTGYDVALNQIPGIASAFGNSEYNDVVGDNEGNLYFATTDTGVVKVNVASGAVTYMPIYYSGIFLADARCLHVASNGHLYVGSRGGDYMAYHNGIEWKVITNIQPFDFGMDRIDDFAEDSQGRVWVGSRTSTLGGFIGRFDEADTTQLFDIINDTTANREFISDRNIEAILIENDTTIYFGVYQENYLLRVKVKSLVSVAELPSPKALKAYPNPVSDKLTLSEVGRGSARVFAITGNLIAESKIENGTLDVSSLSPGVYLLHVVSEKQQHFQMTLIKQ